MTTTTTTIFSDTVNRIVQRVACTESHEDTAVAAASNNNNNATGPLTPQELADLSLLCTQGTADFAKVETELLVALLELLTRHINHAVRVDFIVEALTVVKSAESPSRAVAALEKWIASTGTQRILVVSMALEAASVATYIATTPGIDPRVVNEDDIQASITLMRQHLSKHLIPALNQTGHLLDKQSQSNDPTTTPMTATKRRRRASSDGSTSATGKYLKKVYKCILSTVHLQLLLMERFQLLLERVSLDGSQILSLTNGTLPALQILSLPGSPGQQLQFATLSTVTVAFDKYPTHRDSILEDLFPLLLQLPTGKRTLRCFPVRYSSASSPQSLHALNQAVLGDLLWGHSTESSSNDNNKAASSNGGSSYIQMLTALLLRMVQVCVRKPGLEEDNNHDDNNNTSRRWFSGLQACHAVADAFVDPLLHRCNTTGGDFRPILTHFVEDLWHVFLIPEFPAAEILLASILRRLSRDIGLASPALSRGNNNNKHASAPSSTYLTVAFDALGKMCAVQARILALQRQRPLVMTTKVTTDEESMIEQDDDEQQQQAPNISCYCQQDLQGKVLLVGCTQCRQFYHAPCVGLVSASHDNGDWYCDACRLQHIAIREGLLVDNDDDKNTALAYTARHAYQAALAHRLGVEGIETAKQMHLARWVGELQMQQQRQQNGGSGAQGQEHNNLHPAVVKLLPYWDTPGPSGEILTEEGGARLALYLASEASPLVQSFRDQIRFLLRLVADESSHALRKLSLKAIEKTVEGDPNQMLLPIITKSVSRRLTDDSISVREAALSLVGLYVTRSPVVASAFHSSLLPRLSDTGVSVRKRAVKIFEAILTSNPSYKGRSSVFDALLQRSADPKEEDGVRDLIDNLFSHLWLENSPDDVSMSVRRQPTPHLSGGTDDSSPVHQHTMVQGIVTPPTPPPQKTSKTEHQQQERRPRVDLIAEQMIDVVRSAGSTTNLEALLKKFLGATEEDRKPSERKKRKELDQKQCEKIVKSLFEHLVSLEEKKEERDDGFGKDLAATLRTIAVFSAISPNEAFRQVDSILPYLQADNGVSAEEESAIVAAVCEILYRLGESSNRQKLANRLASTSTVKELKTITCRFGPFALNAAVRAFSCLARQADTIFSRKLSELAKMFYTFLFKKTNVDNFEKADAKTRNNAHRALTVLGCICQYRDDVMDSTVWDEETVDADLIRPQQLDWSNTMIASFRIFSNYLLKEDSSTKCTALRALGGIFVSQPRLLLQLDQEGLIEELMSDSAGVALQLETLQCWSKILKAEEKRIDGGHAKKKMDSDEAVTLSKRISGDQDGDATLFGGVLTNHATRLFALTKSEDATLRYAVLEVLGLLLRQGQINPNDAVPVLFSLLGDVEHSHIRSLALQLLSAETEKRPDTLRRRICAGVKRAYEFQRVVYSHADQISSVVSVGKGANVECIFSRVFRECIGSSRKERRGFFKNLLALFRLNTGSAKKKDLALLQFVSQMLAHLEYRSIDDPLFVIHEITSIVGLQGNEVLDKLSAVLRPVDLASRDECDDDIAIVDALERAARSQFPSRSNEAVPLSSQHFDMKQFVSLCRDGTALSLALQLKTFLRRIYNLSETRCLEYDPSASERICDKVAPKASVSKPFGGTVPRSLIGNNSRVDKDSLILVYARFRELMREESSMELQTEDLEEEEQAQDGGIEDKSKKRRIDQVSP